MPRPAPIPTDETPTPPADFPLPRRQWQLLLAATLLLYACVQFFYVTATPLEKLTLPDNLPPGVPQKMLVGLGPDEKEHFLYIRSLADTGGLPRPDPARRTSPQQYVTYQAQHPPLFYALAALLCRLFARLPPLSVWLLLRGFCTLCGGAVILLTAEAARLSFPNRPFIALAAAPAAAFLPMFGYMTAMLSNEPLAMVFGACVWLQVVQLVRGSRRLTVRSGAVLGLTLGLAALTRLTALLWLPALAAACFACARRGGWHSLGRPALAFALCFGLLLAPWLLYNLSVYGSPVIRSFNRPLIGTSSLLNFVFDPYFSTSVQLTVLFYAATSWGPFWLTRYTLPGSVHSARAWQYLFLALDAAIGASLWLARRRARRDESPPDWEGKLLLWGAGGSVAFCLIVLVQQEVWADWQVIFYAGRYLVAAIPAGTLLLLTACDAWLPRRGRAPRIAAAGLALALLACDAYTTNRVREFYITHPGQPDFQRLNQQQ